MPPAQLENQKESVNTISSAANESTGDEHTIISKATTQAQFNTSSVIDTSNLKENFINKNIDVSLENINREQYLKATFTNEFLGVAILNLQGFITRSNQAFHRMTGYNEEELKDLRLTDIIYPDDVSKHEEAWSNVLTSNSGNATSESRYFRNIIYSTWSRNSLSLMLDEEGNPESVVVISVNINEEKAAQQMAEEITKRFRFLADSMPQLIWTANAKGNLDYFSHAFYDYTGMTSTQMKKVNWSDIVFSEDVQDTIALWQHSLESGDEFVAEHRLKRSDGNYIWQLSRATAQKDGPGNIIMWLGTTSNIHRQKTVADELEKQVAERTRDLQQANFNLKHSNQDLEQFAYIATHDLQEPLRKIRTYASWVNKRHLDALPEEAQDYMIKIENASERMSVLIDDLLNYSLLLRPQEAYETSDLNYVLDQVLNDFDVAINEKNAFIEKMDLPKLKVVPLQIYQLFHNILSNAFKFSKEGRDPVIQITSRTLREEEVIALNLDIDMLYTEIVFKDNGIGFMQEYAEKIFSIFQRLNSRAKYPGTGIGLALCQKIVTYHHGKIYASSNENEGARFYIILPLGTLAF